MVELILYHGTSEANAKKIMKEGFKTGHKYNWGVKSKPGFVYLSKAYAPFYAQASGFHGRQHNKLALIKASVNTKDAYPEDDFIMFMRGKPKYEQSDLDMVNMEEVKPMWPASLTFMGNIAAKPDKVKILGVRFFDGKNLILRCDPVINPTNYKFLGKYYNELSDWIFEGKEIMKFPSQFEHMFGMKEQDAMKKLKEVV